METNFGYKKRNHFLRFLRFLGFGIMGIVAAAAFGFLFGYFVMLLWNWLMPSIFGLGVITFWQAFGLVVLGRILFGGFPHPHRSPDKHWKHHKCGSKPDEWRKWKYYGEYWKEEGEKSFEDYVHRREGKAPETPPAV
jgi:hypothetical protein